MEHDDIAADDAQTCSSPGIAASLRYDLGVAVVLIPNIYAVPTLVTEAALRPKSSLSS